MHLERILSILACCPRIQGQVMQGIKMKAFQANRREALVDRCLSTFLQFGPFLLRLKAYTKLYADARTQSSGKSSGKKTEYNQRSKWFSAPAVPPLQVSGAPKCLPAFCCAAPMHQDRNKFTKDIRLGVFTTMCLGNVRHHKFRRLRLARARFATNQHHLPTENASNMRCSRLFVCLCAACLWVCHVRTNFNPSQSSRNGQTKKWPDWFLHAAEGPVKLCSKKTQLTVQEMQESFCDFSKSLKKQWRRLDCMQTQRIDVGW